MKRRLVAASAACLACAVAAPAQAHVTVHPNAVPAGGFTVLDVRVPNEEAKAATTKVDVQLPPGFIFVSYSPVPGWKAKITFRKLAEPVEVFGEEHTEEADRVIFTATGEGIAPGQFLEFPLSVAVPEKAESPLTFKALQTYSDGEVVRWIGPPDADKPAPQVAVLDAKEAISDVPAGVAEVASHGHDDSSSSSKAAAPAATDDGGDDDDGPSTGLVIAALILGGLGLLAGGAGLASARRARSA